jgi:GNAT superfamily N-acetyltransferase
MTSGTFAGMDLVFRPALTEDADALTALALRSKAYWGYDQDFLDRVRDELSFSPASMAGRKITIAAVDGRMVGFYSIDGDPPAGELGNLWLDPALIGTGVGRRLWRHAVDTARAAGFTSLRIEAEPNAEGFYLTMGAVRVGGTPSGSIPGRILPLLRYDVA